jgi:hypothetical protein
MGDPMVAGATGPLATCMHAACVANHICMQPAHFKSHACSTGMCIPSRPSRSHGASPVAHMGVCGMHRNLLMLYIVSGIQTFCAHSLLA